MNKRYKHGAYGTSEYNVWRSMIQRCTNPKVKNWHLYGGRGITVCQQWRDSAAAFLAYMGPRPSDCELDRIDNNGNYEPGNVRWATHRQNTNNRRVTLLLTAQGQTLPLSEWAERTGLSYELLFDRFVAGWSASRILNPDTQLKDPPITWDDKTLKLSEWATKMGLRKHTLYVRIKRHGLTKAFTHNFDRVEHMRRLGEAIQR